MSLSQKHYILKKHMKVKKINARWIPHLLTNEQKRTRVVMAKILLKMIQEYSKATAKAGGFGIADSVQREMLQLQEVK